MSGKLCRLIIMYMSVHLSFATLEDLETRMESKFHHLERLLEKQNERIQRQEEEITQLKNDLANNQKSDLHKEREITILKELLSKLSRQCTRRNSDNNNVAGNNIAETEKYKRLLVGSIVPTEIQSPRTTAFYAYMSHIDASPGKGHTLKFDVIKTNINGGYNPFSGIFTVPVDGVYVFTFSLRLYSGVYGAYEIIKNAEVEGAAIGIIEGSNTQLQVTETIVFSANKGDIVYVRTHPTLTHTGGVWTNEHGRSMFAGWQI
ncbi:complement C1q-like protein 4 [Mytilus edulis]|uniref:complement C1q-like protein 4 n=1 Tax=Mytilus edulis TaxID=6550 RepID=UPI0039EE0C30